MKFYEIVNAVKEEMRLDPGLVENSERVRFINDCMDDIGKLQLVEIVLEQADVSSQYPTIPSGLTKLCVLYWNGVKLRSLSAGKSSTDTGTPVGYIIEGGRVRLFPKPSAAGTLTWIYTGMPPHATVEMIDTETEDAPTLPESFHSLVVDYACWRSHRKNGNILLAREYKTNYDNSLKEAIRSYVAFLNSQNIQVESQEDSGGGDY